MIRNQCRTPRTHVAEDLCVVRHCKKAHNIALAPMNGLVHVLFVSANGFKTLNCSYLPYVCVRVLLKKLIQTNVCQSFPTLLRC